MSYIIIITFQLSLSSMVNLAALSGDGDHVPFSHRLGIPSARIDVIGTPMIDSHVSIETNIFPCHNSSTFFFIVNTSDQCKMTSVYIYFPFPPFQSYSFLIYITSCEAKITFKNIPCSKHGNTLSRKCTMLKRNKRKSITQIQSRRTNNTHSKSYVHP